MRWWRAVQRGEDPDPPQQSTVFATQSYQNFILLYFKIAAEINIFSHLGPALLDQMKEHMFAKESEEQSESEDEISDESEADKADKDGVIDSFRENNPGHYPGQERTEQDQDSLQVVAGIIESILAAVSAQLEIRTATTTRSLYGKVYGKVWKGNVL